MINNQIKQENKIKILKWQPFALGEGLAKAINAFFSKYYGVYISLVFTQSLYAGSFFSAFVVGIVQTFGGFVLTRIQSRSIFVQFSQIIGSIIFGIIATIMGFLSVYTYTFPGADLATVTFLIALSIIPARLIDRIFYKESLLLRQYIGLTLFILVAWFFLRDFKDPSNLLSMPHWAWPALAIGFFLAINNLITRKLKKADGFVHNFWVGLTTTVISGIAITIADGWNLIFWINAKIWFILIIIGVVTLFMIFVKIKAFQRGANLTFEIFIQQSVYLIFVTFFGILFFQENLTMGKMIGIPGFFIAFILADQEMWKLIMMKNKKLNISS